MKVIVVYESKYGNTRTVAENIVQGLKTGEGTKVELKNLKDVDPKTIPEYDVLLIGSPNHMGGPTRGIKKFIDSLKKLGLKNKQGAAFDTYGGRDFQKAVNKMEKRLSEAIPGLKLITPGLSIKVDKMKGPIAEGELPKCKEFGSRIAHQIGK